jgi:hypothetical protein
MIDDWVDALSKVWEVDDGRGGTVKSYRLFERDEFPETVPLDHATALTFVDSVDFEYSQGGPVIAVWRGTVEYNLAPDLDRKRIPYVLRFFERIMRAAAGNMTLGGKVNYFVLDASGSLEMAILKYGNAGAEHLGIVAKWIVKEVLSDLEVSQ